MPHPIQQAVGALSHSTWIDELIAVVYKIYADPTLYQNCCVAAIAVRNVQNEIGLLARCLVSMRNQYDSTVEMAKQLQETAQKKLDNGTFTTAEAAKMNQTAQAFMADNQTSLADIQKKDAKMAELKKTLRRYEDHQRSYRTCLQDLQKLQQQIDSLANMNRGFNRAAADGDADYEEMAKETDEAYFILARTQEALLQQLYEHSMHGNDGYSDAEIVRLWQHYASSESNRTPRGTDATKRATAYFDQMRENGGFAFLLLNVFSILNIVAAAREKVVRPYESTVAPDLASLAKKSGQPLNLKPQTNDGREIHFGVYQSRIPELFKELEGLLEYLQQTKEGQPYIGLVQLALQKGQQECAKLQVTTVHELRIQ